MQGLDVARRVTRGGAARAGSYVLGSVVIAVGSIFLLRHLGLVEFGRYGTVMALLAIVSGVTEGGLTTTATRDMSLLASPEERRSFLRDLVALRIVLSLLGIAAAVAFALVAGYDRTLVLGTLVAGIGVLLVSVQAALLVPLVVELRNGRVAANEVVRQTLLVIGIIVLSLGGSGLGGFFVNQLVAGALLLAASPLVVGRANLVLPRFNWARSRRLLREAAPLAASTVLATLYFRILVIIASVLVNDRQTALFVTSSRVFELLVGLPLLMVGVVLPVMTVAARDDAARLQYVTQRLTEVATLAGVLLWLVLVLGARPILVVLGGSQYSAVAEILRLQSPMIITLFMVSAWTPALVALHRQRALVLATGLGLTAAVVTGLVLVPLFGARGAAIAAVLAELVNAVGAYVALRHAGVGRKVSFAWVPRLFLVTAAAVAVGLLCPGPDWLTTAAATTAFLGLALAMRLVPPEVLHAARPRRAAPD